MTRDAYRLLHARGGDRRRGRRGPAAAERDPVARGGEPSGRHLDLDLHGLLLQPHHPRRDGEPPRLARRAHIRAVVGLPRGRVRGDLRGRGRGDRAGHGRARLLRLHRGGAAHRLDAGRPLRRLRACGAGSVARPHRGDRARDPRRDPREQGVTA